MRVENEAAETEVIEVLEEDARSARVPNVVGVLSLSYLLAAVLVGSLIWAANLWNLLANTRVLDLLIRSGVVALTDADAGLVKGIPNPDYYLASQDNVDMPLLIFVAPALFLLVWVLKSVQFHGFVRFVGGAGSPRDHVRAFLYGEGVDRFMPFNLGTVAVASALEDQGVPQRQAGQAAALRHLFALFEIVALGIVALVMVGWTTFFGQLFWGVFILAMAYLIVRSRRRPGREPGEGSMLGWLRDALGALAQRPVVFARLLVLSVISFALLPLAAYVISQAFTSTNVILNVDIGILVAAVVAGQIARLIPVTPGGIGQFEWGFAAAVYVAEVGIPEAITVAFLFGFFRYVVDMIVVGKYLWGRVGERPLTLAAETQAGFSRLAPATGSSPPRES